MPGLYIELDLFCLLLLAIVLFDIKKKENTKDQKLFNFFVINTVILCIGDLIYYLAGGKPGQTGRIFAYIGNIIYFLSMASAMYLWLLFVLEKLGIHSDKKKFWRYVWCFPAVILGIFILLTPVLPWIFKINDNNEYERGVAIWADLIVCYGYVLASTTYTLIYIIKDKDKKRRRDYASLLVFAVIPLLSSIFQVIDTTLSLLPAGFTLASVFVYIRLQDSHVWTDTLTGLSNRKYFERYLNDKLTSLNQSRPMFLMMLDIDNFRQLNDLLGHTAGDQALKHLAYILEDESKQRGRLQVARYDGDEFVMFGYDYDVKDTEEIIKSIQHKIEEQNIINGNYSIEVSIGYIRATKDSFMNVDQLMDIADAEMRKNKENKKNMNVIKH